MAAKRRRRPLPSGGAWILLTPVWPWISDLIDLYVFVRKNWWWLLPAGALLLLWGLLQNGWIALGCVVSMVAGVLAARMLYRRHQLEMSGHGGKTWKQFMAALNAERRHFEEIRARWAKLARDNGWTDTDDSDKLAKLQGLTNDAAGDFTASVDCAKYGFDAEKIRSESGLIRDTLKCKDIAIKKNGGTLNLYFYYNDHLDQLLPARKLPMELEPGTMAFGITQDGSPACFDWWMHLLLIGDSGQGKSSIIWALIEALLRQKIWFKLNIADGKGGQELGFLEEAMNVWLGTMMVCRFNTKEPDVLKMLGEVRDAAQKRGAANKGGVRKHTPTQQEPLVITIVDEFVMLPGIIKDGTKSALGQLLAIGRSCGYVVWAASQMPQKEVLGQLRDMFPQRACMRVGTAAEVDAALGPNSYARGAKCAHTDLHPKRDRGIGFMVGEDGNPIKFRAAFFNDDACRTVARGQLVPGLITEKPSEQKRWCTYEHRSPPSPETGLRHVVYVGRTTRDRYDDRTAEHRRDDWWWGEVDESVSVIHDHETYAEMCAEEKRLIKLLKPTRNKVHNRDNPLNKHHHRARPEQLTRPRAEQAPRRRWFDRTPKPGVPADELDLNTREPEFAGRHRPTPPTKPIPGSNRKRPQ